MHHDRAYLDPLANDGRNCIRAERTACRVAYNDRGVERCNRCVQMPAAQTSLHNHGTRGTARQSCDRARAPASCFFRIRQGRQGAPAQRSTSRDARNTLDTPYNRMLQRAEIAPKWVLQETYVSSASPPYDLMSPQKNCSVRIIYATTARTSARPYCAMMYSFVKAIDT